MSEIWFFGTGLFAAECLQNIADEILISLVVTSPPSNAGRGLKEQATPVENAATVFHLPLHRSSSVNKDEELLSRFRRQPPDLILVIDFGQKIAEPWLNGPRCGCLNIHPSMLPKYRGAAPLQRAIADGQKITGVSLFRLVEKMDAGPLWIQAATAIGPEETYGELLKRLSSQSSKILKKCVKSLLSGDIGLQEQNEKEATIASKITKYDTRIKISNGAEKMNCWVRALNPAPGAYFVFRGKRIKLWKAHVESRRSEPGMLWEENDHLFLGTSLGTLELLTVQPEGKKQMEASNWLKGLRLKGAEAIDN